MEFLFDNYPPVKTGSKTFSDAFYSLLHQAAAMDIAVGYVSSDSLAELQKTIELNSNIRRLKGILEETFSSLTNSQSKLFSQIMTRPRTY